MFIIRTHRPCLPTLVPRMQGSISKFFAPAGSKRAASGDATGEGEPAKRGRSVSGTSAAASTSATSAASAPAVAGPPSDAVQAALRAAAEVMNVDVCESWKPMFHRELVKPYFGALVSFLKTEQARERIYPPAPRILECLRLCELSDIRAVILGQDPYHGPGQAHGLSFSVCPGVAQPPSLRNMLKEAVSDVGIAPVKHGYLLSWAKRGVLLLNTILTVREKKPASHSKHGWEQFTDAIIQEINATRSGVVFLLWGKPSQAKAKLINKSKHHILEAAHPSPLSASNGFFGCKHYSKCNELLRRGGLGEIDWSLPAQPDAENAPGSGTASVAGTGSGSGAGGSGSGSGAPASGAAATAAASKGKAARAKQARKASGEGEDDEAAEEKKE